MDTTLPRITTFSGRQQRGGQGALGGTSPTPPAARGGNESGGRGYINAQQYFGNVPPAVWETHIGGYRVAEKWLKDRRGRALSYDDLEHYQSVIAALARTLAIQQHVDAAVRAEGGWPLRRAQATAADRAQP